MMSRTMTSADAGVIKGLSKKKPAKELSAAELFDERLQMKASNRNMYRIKLRQKMSKSINLSEKLMIKLREQVMKELNIIDPMDALVQKEV